MRRYETYKAYQQRKKNSIARCGLWWDEVGIKSFDIYDEDSGVQIAIDNISFLVGIVFLLFSLILSLA